MKVVVAITAASGAIYARQLLNALIVSDEVERVAVIYSANARAVVAHEGEAMPCSAKTSRICSSANAVFPFTLGLPLIRRTFMKITSS